MAQNTESKEKKTPNTRIEIVKPEWLAAEAKAIRLALARPEASRRTRVVSWLVEKLLPLVITVGLGIGGYVFVWNEDRLNAEREVEKSELQQDIQMKIEGYRSVFTSLTNLRATREEILMQCETTPEVAQNPKQLFEANMKRFLARVSLVKANLDVAFAFNDDIEKKIYDFNLWDESVENVCAKDAPNDNAYQKRQMAIQNDLREAIREAQRRLEENF